MLLYCWTDIKKKCL